jgi:hypothetical protein
VVFGEGGLDFGLPSGPSRPSRGGRGQGAPPQALVALRPTAHVTRPTVPPVRSPHPHRAVCLCRIRRCGASHCCTVVGYRCAGGVCVLWALTGGGPQGRRGTFRFDSGGVTVSVSTVRFTVNVVPFSFLYLKEKQRRTRHGGQVNEPYGGGGF